MTNVTHDRCATDVGFLAARQLHRVRHHHPRCYGISSDALAVYGLGYGEEPAEREYPFDAADLAACELTYAMAPPSAALRMEPVMAKYRAAVHARGAA